MKGGAMKGKEEDPEGQALEDLMAAMSSMRLQRIPRPSAAAAPVKLDIPPGLLPTEGPGRDLGAGGGEIELTPGMDPRLAEIIRKKKAGAA